MTSRNLRVLHVTPDDKFFDSVFRKWDSYNCIENKAILIEKDSNYKLKYIKNTEKLHLLWTKKMVKSYFQKEEYDVVFFHSLHPKLYKYFAYIPKDKVVIWWMWGLETYTKNSPLIEWKLFKPITADYLNKRRGLIHKTAALIYRFFYNMSIQHQRKCVISRIDYFKPVLGLEYSLMQKVRGFRAAEFYFANEYGNSNYIKEPKLKEGNVLLGNSGTASNNHLDVLSVIDNYKRPSQKIIVPMNYGENEYIKWVLPQLKQEREVEVITDFLPKEQYYELMSTCTYACFGVLRQQAMGNIIYALWNGIKVFLYKDSIPYINLKEIGFVVYAIEDIDEESFRTPLSIEEMIQNQKAAAIEHERRFEIFEKWRVDMEKRFGVSLNLDEK